MGLDKKNVITFDDLVTYFRGLSALGSTRESIGKSPFYQKPPYSAPERYTQATSQSGSVNYHFVTTILLKSFSVLLFVYNKHKNYFCSERNLVQAVSFRQTSSRFVTGFKNRRLKTLIYFVR